MKKIKMPVGALRAAGKPRSVERRGFVEHTTYQEIMEWRALWRRMSKDMIRKAIIR